MIESIKELSPAVEEINSHMLLIVTIFLALPIFSIALFKLKAKAVQKNNLTEPLLENKE